MPGVSTCSERNNETLKKGKEKYGKHYGGRVFQVESVSAKTLGINLLRTLEQQQESQHHLSLMGRGRLTDEVKEVARGVWTTTKPWI